MKRRLLLLTPIWITGFLLLGLAACTGDTIVLHEVKKHTHVRGTGVDVLVSSTFGKEEVLVRDAVEVQLYEEGYEECIRVYINPYGDKKEIALARCGNGMGFRVAMRTTLVDKDWEWRREPVRNNFSIDFGNERWKEHHEEPEEK
jgi:hypothetical protein